MRRSNSLLVVLSFILVSFLLSLAQSPIRAAETSPAVERATASRTQLWLISTRHLPCNPCCDQTSGEAPEFKYWINDGDGHWIASDKDTFNASSSPIAVMVPGAPATLYETKSIGELIYNRFLDYLPSDGSLRWVIFTWPTEQSQRRRLRDFREKSYTAESQGFYLAHFIDAQPADVPVSLLGYSFGAKVSTAALHLLGGGRIHGCDGFETRRPLEARVSAVLTAGAMDNWWLCEDDRYCQALPYADHILNTYNRCDPLLKRYHLLYGLRRGPQAIGYTGTSLRCLGAAGEKFSQVDVTRWIGKTHAPTAYLTPKYLELTAPTLLSLEEEAVAVESE